MVDELLTLKELHEAYDSDKEYPLEIIGISAIANLCFDLEKQLKAHAFAGKTMDAAYGVMRQQINDLQADVMEYKKAMKFYANPDNYTDKPGIMPQILHDKGNIAWQTILKLNKKVTNEEQQIKGEK